MPVLELREPRAPGTNCLAQDEIAVIAKHEHLTLEEAAARGAEMLREPWGHAAMRQMVWDTLTDARRRADESATLRLTELYRRTCRRYPCPHDRRTSPTRERHPFPFDERG
ncbi:hypothetical protein [Azospirillum doebereinerae]|uniref:Uncharacterized protein n=1 Tax=Azospirillum doebereinerae TaxID=92933 RepID=A0A3S0WJ80_9PROT|nr:hypothetical protein [Azospirillum doebereinerae]MCG5243778.1 hypothetical protein [Azospirillum doebereinerae]RUQ65980.1 hypothetical protein EJ913_24350 [Azospirillum doebereinerae]